MKHPAKQPLFMTQMTHSHGKLGPRRESLYPLVGPIQQFYSTTCCNVLLYHSVVVCYACVCVCVFVCVYVCVQHPPPAVCSPSLLPSPTYITPPIPSFAAHLFANPYTTVGVLIRNKTKQCNCC